MARPQRCRCVCSLPSQDTFAPIDSACTDTIVMTIDEYEVIRLMDVGCHSNECRSHHGYGDIRVGTP